MSRIVVANVLIDGWPIDAVVKEAHEFDSEVTEYPVESGIEISDNIRIKPLRVTLECYVSNTPMGTLFDVRFPTDAAPEADDPADDAYARMLQIRKSRKTVTINTSLDEFQNMALVSFSVPRSSGEPDHLHFTAVFQQVTFITNERTTVPVAAPRIAKKTNLGHNPMLNNPNWHNVASQSLQGRADFVNQVSSEKTAEVQKLDPPVIRQPVDHNWWRQQADKSPSSDLEPYNANQKLNDSIQDFINK